MKFTLYATAKVLPGNKIEVRDLNLEVGQTVEVVIVISESTPDSSFREEESLSLKQRLDFLKLPISERRRILKRQAETMLEYYQQDSEFKDF